MFRQVLPAQPDDVGDGLRPGTFTRRTDFPAGGLGGGWHQPSMA